MICFLDSFDGNERSIWNTYARTVLLLPRAHVRQERSEYTLFSMLVRARTGTTHGNCSGSYVTYFQRDEVKRAGARGNSRAGLATHSIVYLIPINTTSH